MTYTTGFKSFFFFLLEKLLGWLMRPTVTGGAPGEIQFKSDVPVCYVIQTRSITDLILLDRVCKDLNLPSPAAPISYNGLEEKRSFFFLTRPDGSEDGTGTQGYSPRMQRLIKAAEHSSDQAVQLIPVNIIWGRSPDVENSPFKLLFSVNWGTVSSFRKLMAVMIHGRQSILHFGQSMPLPDLVEKIDEAEEDRNVRKVARVLRVHFRQFKTSVIGPDLSHRRTVIRDVLADSLVQDAVQIEVDEKGITHTEAMHEAREYANEIASDVSHYTIRFLEKLLGWFWNRFYNGTRIHNIEGVKEVAKSHALVYLPCHRSHIDYLLLSYVLYKNNLSTPHIAAGLNLNMPVVGRILRSGGAFFIRRSFKGNQLYTAVFNSYLHVLFTKGFPTEFFIEGGRSRTGRTLQPKTGMLAITIRSFLRNHRRPIALVPIYVGYERSIEISSYLTELRGKKKKNESVLDILKTLKKLKGNFGEVNVNFGETIYLDRVLDATQPGWKETSSDNNYRPDWLKDVTDALSMDIVRQINASTAVNPINLVSAIMLASPRLTVTEEDLLTSLQHYVRLFQTVPYSAYSTMTDMPLMDMVRYAEHMNLISRYTDPLGDVYTVDPTSAVIMTYFRNNILHLFALPSLIACFFKANDRFNGEQVIHLASLLYPYLRQELFIRYDNEEIPSIVNQWLDAFVEFGYVLKDSNGLYSVNDGNTESEMILGSLSHFVSQTLERFLIVAAILKRHDETGIDRETLEDQCHALGRRLSMLHGLNSPEYFDRTLFRSFIDTLINSEFLQEDEDHHLRSDRDMDIILNGASFVLSADVRKSIIHVIEKDHEKARHLHLNRTQSGRG